VQQVSFSSVEHFPLDISPPGFRDFQRRIRVRPFGWKV